MGCGENGNEGVAMGLGCVDSGVGFDVVLPVGKGPAYRRGYSVRDWGSGVHRKKGEYAERV